MPLEITPFITVPCGWMRCIACSDYRRRPGMMWLGYTIGGADDMVPCPVCQGTGQVPRIKQLDVRTGREIDYERPGQSFVPVRR